VDRRVLVPRPETEGIIEAALEFGPPRHKVADLGTGSGNIIIALSREVEPGEWYGTDISAEALQVAGLNLRRHGLEGRVTLLEGDLFDALPAGGRDFGLLLSNPPYVPSADIGGLQPEIRLHEPRGALDGGPTGLDVLRRLISGAPDRLRSGGVLVVEVGTGQGTDVRSLAVDDGRYSRVESRRDLAGRERIIVAVRD
jgi:release factor glutamine methyltransferase